MLTHTSRWSHPRGNEVVPSRWQATPNIGAFIAWGLITALFIPTGWLPNEKMATLVGPMILTLLPILIGYTGGRMVHGQRGAVVGAIATIGVIVGTDIPMFLGAMIIGPLAAYLIKLVDRSVEDRVPSGFEMLIDNFSAGIVGGAMAVLGLYGIGPIVRWMTEAARVEPGPQQASPGVHVVRPGSRQGPDHRPAAPGEGARRLRDRGPR